MRVRFDRRLRLDFHGAEITNERRLAGFQIIVDSRKERAEKGAHRSEGGHASVKS